MNKFPFKRLSRPSWAVLKSRNQNVSPPAQSLLDLVRDEYGVEYGAVNHLPRQLQATTHPALIRRAGIEDTTVEKNGQVFAEQAPE